MAFQNGSNHTGWGLRAPCGRRLSSIAGASYNLRMTVLRAHFDGKVFVPDEPLGMRPGRVTLHVIELDMDLHPVTGLPILRVPSGAKTITSEDVRRAMDEDD